MANFQALHLDAGRIAAAVHGFPGAIKVSGPASKGKFEEYARYRLARRT